MITILTQRVFYDVVGRSFLRGLMLPLLVLLIAAAALDASADWGALRRDLAGLAPRQQTIVFTTLVLGWSWQAGRALRPVWRHPTIAFLVRQPINRLQWVAGLLPSLAVAFVPIAVMWWLAPNRAGVILHYFAFIGLAWPLVLGASFTGLRSAALIAIGTLTLAAMVYAYAHSALFAYAALIVSAVQLPLSTVWIPRQIAPVHERITGHLGGSTVAAALMRRDLRCVRRTGWRPLANLAALGIVGAAMMYAFRINGGVETREAFLTACVMFSIAASPVYEILERMKAALGEEIMRRRWPVTLLQRTYALAGIVAVLVGPAAVFIAVGGWTMGWAYLGLYALFVAVTIAACSGIYALLLPKMRSAVGVFYLVLLGHGVFAFALPAWGYALFAVAALPAGVLTSVRGLAAFTGRAQRMRFGTPA